MADRKGLFDDVAGLAGGAVSVLSGIRDEIESLVKSRLEETIRRLDLVKREELDAVREIAANARTGQELAETRLAAVEAELAAVRESLKPQPDMLGGEGEAP